jgi:hypothetical protein
LANNFDLHVTHFSALAPTGGEQETTE